MGMGYRILGIWCGLLAMVGCTQQPQQVRHLHDKTTPDSAVMAQIEFNMQMANAADKACSKKVAQDSLTYVMDEFGFWYTKTKKQSSEPLKSGEEVLLDLIMWELNDTLVADVQNYFIIGGGDLPIAITRSLKQMCRGEEMRIIAPWYTLYGIEGTSLIKPYTNLVITLKVNE
jgi:hypothetical protein